MSISISISICISISISISISIRLVLVWVLVLVLVFVLVLVLVLLVVSVLVLLVVSVLVLTLIHTQISILNIEYCHIGIPFILHCILCHYNGWVSAVTARLSMLAICSSHTSSVSTIVDTVDTYFSWTCQQSSNVTERYTTTNDPAGNDLYFPNGRAPSGVLKTTETLT